MAKATTAKPPSKPPAKKPAAKPAPKPKTAGKKPPPKKATKKPSKSPAKVKAKEIDWNSPEQLAKTDAESHRLITAKRREVADLKNRAQESKEQAADDKKKWELSRKELEELIDDRERWRGHKPPGVQQYLPGAGPNDPPPADTPHAIGPGVVPADPVAPKLPAKAFTPDAPHADLWRQFPLDRWTIFGATPSDVQKLKEGKLKKETGSVSITTVGELADFTKPFASDATRNRQFTDIKGIGAEAATRISDAEIRFWNEWNTKGLKEEFAKEKGVSLNPEKPADGNGEAQPEAGKGTPGKPEREGNRKGKGGSARADGGGAKGAGGKPKKKGQRRPIKHTPTTTPKINPSGVDPAEPFAGEQPATIPFDDRDEDQRDRDADGQREREATSA